MLWVPKGLVVGIVGFALEVRAESSAKYNVFTCDPLFVEVRCLIFIRGSFFPTHGEDVDVASVVYCHFRQVCDNEMATFRRHTPATCGLLASWEVV